MTFLRSKPRLNRFSLLTLLVCPSSVLLLREDHFILLTSYSRNLLWSWGVSLALVLDVAKVLKADSKFFLSPTFSFEENCSFKMLQRGREPKDIAASFLISALNQTKDLFVWSTDELLDQWANRLVEISHKTLMCKIVGSNISSRHNIYKFHRNIIYRGMSKEFIFSHENWTSLQRGVSFEAWTR